MVARNEMGTRGLPTNLIGWSARADFPRATGQWPSNQPMEVKGTMPQLYATGLRIWAAGHHLRITLRSEDETVYVCDSRGIWRQHGHERQRITEAEFQQALNAIAQHPEAWHINVENEALEVPEEWTWDELCRAVQKQVRF